MTVPSGLVSRLRNVSIRQWIAALERAGFFSRRSRGGHRIYRHSDGRRVVLSFHRAGATLPPGTLHRVLLDTKWTEEDAERLGLLQR